MVGRKPKSTLLHAVEGTYNTTRHRKRKAEPKPKGSPVKPKFITGAASEIWDEYAVIGYWLTSADSKTFAAWCGLTAELEADLAGMPAARIGRWCALSSMLGFDPSARSRIHTSEEDEKPADKYFA